MSHYYYKCFDCKKTYSADEIEYDMHYLCPKCARVEKNHPLNGVLTIEYDYEEIKKKLKRKILTEIRAGKFWKYSFLWPLEQKLWGSTYRVESIDEKVLENLSLNENPIKNYVDGERTLSFFDDTQNPTLSFKDRASILTVLKGFQFGKNEISVASTGNAGSSLAGICAKLGLKSHVFVPKNIPDAKRIQIQSYGANLYLVDGDYDTAFDLSTEVSSQKGWYNRNTAYNPMTIEGKKSAAYDLYISTNGKLPDYIFVPAGDGVIISGIYKGLVELKELELIEELPKLIAVQSEKSNAIVRYVTVGKFEYRPAETIADSISAGAPRNLYMAAKAVRKTKGNAISVSDEEIIEAQKNLATKFGILAEPAAAASYAGYKKIEAQGVLRENVKILLMITGNGIKDTASLEKWNDKPIVTSPDELRERFGIN